MAAAPLTRRFPLPRREQQRVAALHRLNVLDTPPEGPFDNIVTLASHICATPIAAVSFVDSNRQWFKSRIGLEVEETPRDVAFCTHAILGAEVFEVPDAAADDRFAANPLVTQDPKIRFYAGAPVATRDGLALGMVCVIDRKPRALTGAQREELAALSRQVAARLPAWPDLVLPVAGADPGVILVDLLRLGAALLVVVARHPENQQSAGHQRGNDVAHSSSSPPDIAGATA